MLEWKRISPGNWVLYSTDGSTILATIRRLKNRVHSSCFPQPSYEVRLCKPVPNNPKFGYLPTRENWILTKSIPQGKRWAEKEIERRMMEHVL